MQPIERDTAGALRGCLGRTAWAGARHCALPNDLAATSVRPASVPVARGAHHKNHGPAERPK